MNDLIGLRYGWGNAPSDGSGKTDCFQLVCEIRQRLGLTSYTDKFAWVYDSYADETFPRRMIVRWLLEHGRRINAPEHGAVVLLPGLAGAALATALDGDVLFIAPSQNVVRSQLPEGIGHYFWMDR